MFYYNISSMLSVSNHLVTEFIKFEIGMHNSQKVHLGFYIFIQLFNSYPPDAIK